MTSTSLTAKPVLLALCKTIQRGGYWQTTWRCGAQDCGEKFLVKSGVTGAPGGFGVSPGYMLSKGQGLYLKSRRAASSMKHYRIYVENFVCLDVDEMEALRKIDEERDARITRALHAHEEFLEAFPDPFDSHSLERYPRSVLDFINEIDMSDLEQREKEAHQSVARVKRKREDTYGAVEFDLSGALFFKCSQCGRISKICLTSNEVPQSTSEKN